MVTAEVRVTRYDAADTGASNWFRELSWHRDLLYMLTWREVKVKYKQSIMGMLWAVLMPTVIVAAGVTVRYAFARVSGVPVSGDDLAAVAVKSVPWAFFVSAVRFGGNSLISNTSLVTRVYVPREVFPLASVLSALLDFTVASVALLVVLVIAGTGVSIYVLWVPVLVVVLVLQTTALAVALSAASLFFRDVKYLADVFLMFAIFFTPVFFEASLFGAWAPLLLLNPVAPLLEGLHAAVVQHTQPSLGWVAYSATVGVAGCAAAMAFFKRVEPFFAESV